MKINEVSERSAVSHDTLRYYERIGLIPPVPRGPSGIRQYGEVDVQRIEFIKCMRRAGLPIEALLEYMRLSPLGDASIEARKAILREQRDLLAARIADMHKTLDLLDYKIHAYESALLQREKELAAGWMEPVADEQDEDK